MRSVLTLLMLGACGPSDPPPAAARLRLGYTAAASATTADIEQRFAGALDAGSISAHHRALTARPHPTGSRASKDVADSLRKTLEGFGLEVAIHEYQVLHSKPRRIALTMTAPSRRPLSLEEAFVSLTHDRAAAGPLEKAA